MEKSDKICTLVIDGGICENKHNFEMEPHPCQIAWFKKGNKVKVNKQCLASFSMENGMFNMLATKYAGKSTDVPIELESLLKEFEDIMQVEYPKGWPPLRDVQHQIE